MKGGDPMAHTYTAWYYCSDDKFLLQLKDRTGRQRYFDKILVVYVPVIESLPETCILD
jgi:hypothetical protein